MRILCVDDDGLTLAVTADLLRELGHEVTEATDGASAAQALSTGAPIDLLVTDVHMPGGLHGHDLAILARVERPDLPVIFFSGQSDALPEGVTGMMLRKPCFLGELQQAINSVAH